MIGHIDSFDNQGYISGWLRNDINFTKAIITIDGIPLWSDFNFYQRDDVTDFLGVEGKHAFRIKVDRNVVDSSIVKLYCLNNNSFELIAEKEVSNSVNFPFSISRLDEIRKIAADPDSVAITVWEGKHNPLGRAKVLYDIVSIKRPCCIIAFDFSFSKSDIWEPLISSNIPIFMLTWPDRTFYKSFFESNAISFNTIWACKPRLPTIELARIIGNKSTKVILDIDDNEEHLSSSAGGRTKPFGSIANSRIKGYVEKCLAKSVASISLQEKYGGKLVRHVRKTIDSKISPFKDEHITIGFIGTVRPHKGIIEAAERILNLKRNKNLKVKFVVGGHFYPSSLEKEIELREATSIGAVGYEELYEKIQQFDIVLTGYPAEGADNDPITYYQISSKIGDGLCCGRPVMVPEGASVKDLSTQAGIYLFNHESFEETIEQVIKEKILPTLPEEFTLEHAYETFSLLEDAASTHNSRTKNKGKFWESLFKSKSLTKNDDKDHDNFLLIWKQCDAGLYGRRIDLVARGIKKERPNATVRVLEICHKNLYNHLKSQEFDPVSDASLILNYLDMKLDSYERSGVIYDCIKIDKDAEISDYFEKYLLKNKIFTDNSKVVIFPLIPCYRDVIHMLDGYNVSLDIVDNQLSWASDQVSKNEALLQYFGLGKRCNKVIFNSNYNKTYFVEEMKMFLDCSVSVIENWYKLPEFESEDPLLSFNEKFKLVYSGNLNDRFDWELLKKIANEFTDQLEILIIGSASRVRANIEEVCKLENVIYLGALEERQCLSVLKYCDLAIMPHLNDSVSKFMNPLKLKMYRSLNLKSISTLVEGIDDDDEYISVAYNHDIFLEKIDSFIKGKNKAKNKAKIEALDNEQKPLIEYLKTLDVKS